MSGTSFDPRIVVRPRTLDETVDLALAYVRICLRDFGKVFFWLTALTLGLVAAITIPLELDLRWQLGLIVLLSPVFERAVTVYGGRHLFGHQVRLGGALAQALKQFPLAIGSSLIANSAWLLIINGIDGVSTLSIPFGILLGMVLPFVLGAHLYLREVTHLEHLDLHKAMSRARTLVQYRFDRALGVLTVSFLVRGATAALAYSWVRFTAEFVLQFTSVPTALPLWSAAAGWVAAGQFLTLMRLFDYVDARTRREGWDIQVRFDAIKHADELARARRMAA